MPTACHHLINERKNLRNRSASFVVVGNVHLLLTTVRAIGSVLVSWKSDRFVERGQHDNLARNCLLTMQL